MRYGSKRVHMWAHMDPYGGPEVKKQPEQSENKSQCDVFFQGLCPWESLGCAQDAWAALGTYIYICVYI